MHAGIQFMSVDRHKRPSPSQAGWLARPPMLFWRGALDSPDLVPIMLHQSSALDWRQSKPVETSRARLGHMHGTDGWSDDMREVDLVMAPTTKRHRTGARGSGGGAKRAKWANGTQTTKSLERNSLVVVFIQFELAPSSSKK